MACGPVLDELAGWQKSCDHPPILFWCNGNEGR
jgi:hypothetical protein